MRKLRIAATVAGALAGFVILVLPFARPLPSNAFIPDTSHVSRCLPPIVSSWRRDDGNPTGWFGYAPLTTNPPKAQSCNTPARKRLALGGGLLVAAGLIVAIPRWLRRRSISTRSP